MLKAEVLITKPKGTSEVPQKHEIPVISVSDTIKTAKSSMRFGPFGFAAPFAVARACMPLCSTRSSSFDLSLWNWTFVPFTYYVGFICADDVPFRGTRAAILNLRAWPLKPEVAFSKMEKNGQLS